MADKKQKNNVVVPNVLGLLPEIAGDVFDDHNVKYEIQDKKIISFFRDKNCVVKTLPKKGTSISADEIVKVYTCKFKIGPWIILGIILIAIILFILNKSGVTPLFFGEPVIDQNNKTWDKSSIIYVKDDADFNYSTIDHYEYCVSKNKNSNTCEWNKTYTKSIRVSKSGVWYVWFKGISKDNNESSISNRLKVQIDNEAPIITSIDKTVTTRSIEVRVNAKDSLSNVDKYYYSLDNHEFIEGNKSYIFTSLDENRLYTIKVRVVDKAGNKIDSELNITTLSTNKDKETTTETPKTIPQISLNDIPSYITEEDDYNIPTEVNPSKNKDNVICTDESGNTINNTNTLGIGKHTITCSSTIDNLNISTYKDIEVTIKPGLDEIDDEYAKINITYPNDATNCMYRIISDEVRVDGEGWNYYVGRLYIKKELVDKIIIKYDLNGEKIVSRDNLFIDIVPDKYKVNINEEVEVKINTNNTEAKIYYQVNSDDFKEYKGPFKVKGNSLINAYIETTYKSYDKEKDTIVDNSIIKTDSIYIESIYPTIGDKNNTDVSISLDKIPDTINTSEVYSIPSSYSYGTHDIFKLVCISDNKIVNSTSDLTKGEHDIVCTITALDGETKQERKHINIEYDNYKYDLDNIPSIINKGDEYILDNTCNIKNTSNLKTGKYTITCNKLHKDIEVIENDTPNIDLNNIPDEIVIGSLYQLPSHYKGTGIKFIKCIDEDNNLLYNTSTLTFGNHTITCIIADENGLAITNKSIKVVKPKYSIVISK